MWIKHWAERSLSRCLYERGMFRYLLLYYLREGPAHGYALMKRIAEDFHWLYLPSPGIIYPTLQLLEDQGYVTHVEENGRKKYALTPKGEKLIEEKGKLIERIVEIRERRKEIGKLVNELWPSVKELLHTIGSHLDELDKGKIERIREIIERAINDIRTVLKG